MKPEQKPTKEQVREWLKEQIASRKAPPSLEEIRRQLGWTVITQSRKGMLR